MEQGVPASAPIPDDGQKGLMKPPVPDRNPPVSTPPKIVRNAEYENAKETDKFNEYQNDLAQARIRQIEGDRRYDSVENIRAGRGFGNNSPRLTNREAKLRDEQREEEKRIKNKPKTINPQFSPDLN